MTRTLAHCLDAIRSEDGGQFQLWSLYDNHESLKPNYVTGNNFRAFNGNKPKFFKELFSHVKWPDLVIISHINLAIAGLLVKLINPKCNVWLVAHGIEVWQHLSPFKKAFLKRCDKIVCVSSFTKNEILRLHKVPNNKCVVLNNALDPFWVLPQNFEKPAYLQQRYQLNEESLLLFTLARIHHAEQYKGYDKVIESLAELKKEFPGLKYILAGMSDPAEQERIERLIAKAGLTDNIILAGFIDEKELTDHFLLADVFVMPSTGEGFGLVLIEAAACGTQVICGNSDGSVDAILNGELGESININDPAALDKSITNKLNSPINSEQKRALQTACLQHFSVEKYKEKLHQLICNER